MIFRKKKEKIAPVEKPLISGVEHLKRVWHIGEKLSDEPAALRTASTDIYRVQTGSVPIPRRRTGRTSKAKD